MFILYSAFLQTQGPLYSIITDKHDSRQKSNTDKHDMNQIIQSEIRETRKEKIRFNVGFEIMYWWEITNVGAGKQNTCPPKYAKLCHGIHSRSVSEDHSVWTGE